MKIAIYGGASAKPGEPAYEDARRLGFILGQAGHTILTGGYIGVMEAASRGANEAGAHVIGSTCEQLELWRGVKANQWVKEEWKHQNLRDRMYKLIDACDAAVIMPGGVGTLAELSVMWNEEIISRSQSRPMILVGRQWRKVIEMFFEGLGEYVPVKEQKRVFMVDSIEEVLGVINQFS